MSGQAQQRHEFEWLGWVAFDDAEERQAARDLLASDAEVRDAVRAAEGLGGAPAGAWVLRAALRAGRP